MASPTNQALDEFLVQCRRRVNAVLEELLTQPLPGNRLTEALQYAVLGGGKRIRPVLVYAGAEAVGGGPDAADRAAAAVELIHCYSLVHDDLPAMDDDNLRRGKPSLHKAFDDATAILAGDALQALAFKLLSEADPAMDPGARLRMINLLAEAGCDMVAGQTLDFEASAGASLSVRELETMHRLKTGALIKAGVLSGAMSHPQANAAQLHALETYADCIGLAFQVRDDILDVESDTWTLGKPQGSDRGADKPTYVSLLGLEAAKTRAAELVRQAQESLRNFSGDADHLREIADYIVNRSH